MQPLNQLTKQNMREAISGEAQAAVLYEFFAKQARKEGREEIALAFDTVAKNEKAHAEVFFRRLECIRTTELNLQDAILAEQSQWTRAYKKYASDARDENDMEAGALFDQIGAIEKEHETTFQSLLDEFRENRLESATTETVWICTNCGHRHTGISAPDHCPVCGRPQSFFKQQKV